MKLEVYQCDGCPKHEACGFNGEGYDCSRDECHHPLSLETANEMARRWNLVEEQAKEKEAAKKVREMSPKQRKTGSSD